MAAGTVTTRRYYDDAYTIQFVARIVEHITIHGRPAVILDETYFYPTGGGQPHDTGTLMPIVPEGGSGPVQVVDVQTRAEDKAVVHILSAPFDGDAVSGSIDWPRRFDLMQQHTGQHILSQAFIQVKDASTIGFHLGTDVVTIDIAIADINQEILTQVEVLANDIIFTNTPVTTRLISLDEAEGVRMRRVPEALATDGLRVVEIGTFDVTACGGTHVARAGEIGMIKILATEKYKGGTRVTFVCGSRALKAAQVRTTLLNTLVTDLSCAMSEIPDAVARLREQTQTHEKTLKSLREQLVEYEGEALIAQAEPLGDNRLVILVEDGGDATAMRLLAARIVREPGMIALLAVSGDKVQVICARSSDVNMDMNMLLKAALTPLGGKGGGQPALAQGGAGAVQRDIVLNALRAAAEQREV